MVFLGFGGSLRQIRPRLTFADLAQKLEGVRRSSWVKIVSKSSVLSNETIGLSVEQLILTLRLRIRYRLELILTCKN